MSRGKSKILVIPLLKGVALAELAMSMPISVIAAVIAIPNTVYSVLLR